MGDVEQDGIDADDHESGSSFSLRIHETQRREGDGRGVATSTGHTASAVRPIPVVRTPPTAAASSLLNLDGLIHVRGMSRTESMKCRQKFVTQRISTFVKAELFRRIKFIRSGKYFRQCNAVGDGSRGCAASTPSQFPEDIRNCFP